MGSDTRQRAALQWPSSMRLPGGIGPAALAGHAYQVWSLAAQGQRHADADGAVEAATPLDEYKSVCDFMRLYATLRFYQLALLLGTTGSIVTALTSLAVHASFARAEILRGGGLLVSLAFLVMEYRASSYWHGLRNRGNQLAEQLHFQRFPVSSRWNPLTTSGAAFYLHGLVSLLWLASLVLRLPPPHPIAP